MKMTLRLLSADLRYPDELKVHTAASGSIGTLCELYLTIERSDGFDAVGEVRANIAYLTGMPTEAVAPAIRDLCRRLPWQAEPEQVLADLAELGAQSPSVARAVVESALVEGLARRDGRTVAAYLGGVWQNAVPTNQCLFWGPDDQFDRLAERYVAEGFCDLKVRIGIASFEEDLARLTRLRERFGDDIRIAVDANGSWGREEALDRLARLERFDLSYVEQPTVPGDWESFAEVVSRSPTPCMIDEGLMSVDDLNRLVAIGAPVLAHLKIVKFGGPLQVVRAARRLAEHGVAVMVGQMNEGGLATAMTAHCAMATRPKHAELYGCYGLLDDPASGPVYDGGAIRLRDKPGLGATLDASRCSVVWTERFG